MRTVDLDQLADRLEAAADAIGPAIERRMRHVGARGVAAIRSNASGRPGPNIITGAYWASWKDVHQPIPHGAQCTIGTSKPQGRRLEFGFYDMTDSLGRHFFQPPYPHVQPALPFIGATLREQMGLAAEEALT
ncbi:HK97 gp10 family phage protein [Streptomyces sp. NPDC015346]|uniref:HK97 gp10 family phage protein n=1 Tax=Streptomyces sp. NPDC015346 TaxID=3364954 RepID=UPI003703624E